MSGLDFFLQRELIIFLALTGAIIATIGSYLVNRRESVSTKLNRFVLHFGYTLTFVSIGLFIVAGFLGKGQP